MLSLPKLVDPPPQTRDPAYVPDERAISPWEYVNFLWRRRWLILGTTLASALVVTIVVLMMPRRYRAEATVFLTPPTYKTTLRPDVMSVEAYAELAQTEHILSLVAAALNAKHPEWFGSSGEEAPGISYSARLSASREPQKPYLPLIGLRAVADTPEQAREAANSWADVFITEQSKISAVGKSNAADFILHEYPKIEETLVSNENELRALLAKQAEELAALKAELGLPLKTAQLENFERLVVDQEDAIANARSRMARLRPSVEQLEKELAATPKFLVVNKAISDDALWEAQSSDAAAKEALGKAQLRSEEINPVYVSLSQRLAEERVNLNSLAPQIEILEKQLEATRARAAELRRELLDGERRIAEMERRHKIEAGSLRRAVDAARYSYDMLSDKIGEARLAQAEPNQDLKLGAYAGLPSSPVGPRRVLLVAGGTAAGFTLSIALLLLLAWVRGHQRDLQPSMNEPPASRA